MSTINLTDKFGLNLNVTPSPGSAFAKYLKSPAASEAVLNDLKAIKDLQVGQDPFGSVSVGVSFKEPIKLGATGDELTIDPQLAASVGVKKDEPLFSSKTNPFGDDIAIPPGQAYVSLGFEARLDVAASGATGRLDFGIDFGTEISFTNYRLFSLTDQVVSALGTLFENFGIPANLEDIDSMAEGNVAAVQGTGSLKLSAQANLLSTINPLATVGTIAGQGVLQVKEGGSLIVKAAYTLTGEYQVRVHRLAGRKFQLGYYKVRGSDFNVSVEGAVTISATVEGIDLPTALLQSISSDPAVDKDALHTAGLSNEQIASITAAIKAGIQRSLQLSVQGELDFLNQSSVAFKYEIDLDALAANGQQAVSKALGGDLTMMETMMEEGPQPGITPLVSIFSTLRQGKQILKVNLLGIFNYGSVTTLLSKGTVIVDEQSGDITITDQAGADRIGFSANNFAKDGAKLRQILADSILITAAYSSSGTVPVARSISSKQWFFEFHEKTNPQTIEHYLNIVQALQLIKPSDVSDELASVNGITSFGQSTFIANASYDDSIFKSLFLNAAGNPRAQNEYESIGRETILSLLPQANRAANPRALPLTDDGIWQAMKKAGFSNHFGGLFNGRGFNAVDLGNIETDYTYIVWWASTMEGMGLALAKLLGFIAQSPDLKADLKNDTFMNLRKGLDNAMASVTKRVKNEFSEPFGLLAMDLASGQRAATTVQMRSAKLTLSPQPRTLTN
jgi:hypothetical protein